MALSIMYTEYDVAVSNVWKAQLKRYTAGILRTRILASDQLVDDIEAYKKDVIVHAIFSGFEGTIYEPHCPDINTKIQALWDLASFMKPEQIVLRINPVITTRDGYKTAAWILKAAPVGIRVRMDFLRQTTAVRTGLEKLTSQGGFKLPWDSIETPIEYKLKMLNSVAGKWGDKFKSISVCCEHAVPAKFRAGCVGREDHVALGLPKWYHGQYKPVNNSCTCAKTKVPVYDKKAIIPCLWDGTL